MLEYQITKENIGGFSKALAQCNYDLKYSKTKHIILSTIIGNLFFGIFYFIESYLNPDEKLTTFEIIQGLVFFPVIAYFIIPSQTISIFSTLFKGVFKASIGIKRQIRFEETEIIIEKSNVITKFKKDALTKIFQKQNYFIFTDNKNALLIIPSEIVSDSSLKKIVENYNLETC